MKDADRYTRDGAALHDHDVVWVMATDYDAARARAEKAEASRDRLAALVREMEPYMMYPPVATIALDAARAAVDAAGDLEAKP